MLGLNPGIRETVLWLRKQGFETTDSGDGRTHDYACDRPDPYVVIQVEPERLITESHRLWAVVQERLTAGKKMILGSIGNGPYIQASYDPSNQIALLELVGVTDWTLGLQLS